uniref:Uncharacterized protein n=1 Tax=uncultured prokaryote TaxID=198431 RepID=A0A0H5Q7C8_9ZZZZ|nr:hypothetical protein [uncultured prokaryote]
MNVSLTVYKSGPSHKLSVVARPGVAAVLGEYILIEGVALPGLGESPTAVECLHAAYNLIAAEVQHRLRE